jgi:hypothetical protein
MRSTKTIITAVMLAIAGCGGGNNNGGGPDAAVAADAPAGKPGSSFDQAIDITGSIDVGTGTMATLPDTKTKIYYKVTLAAADRLLIATATNARTKNDGSVTDTFVTLYDPSKTAIAQDDDGWPRDSTDSSLWTESRAAGTYYITVEDCNSHSQSGCYPATGVTDLAFTLHVLHPNKLVSPEVNANAAQDGTTAHAQAIPYAVPSGGTAGDYGLYTLDGNFAAAGGTHVFSFTAPAAAVTAGSRQRAEFWVQPVTATNGDGSTANVKMWVTPANGTTILGQADESNHMDGDSPNGPLDLSVPVTKNTPYFLFVQSDAATSAPATDYYFVMHYDGQYFFGSSEQEGATGSGVNDTYQTAQVLATPTGATAGSFFADGNISKNADVDWYELDPPAGTKTASLGCEGAREGSGLVGLSATLYAADGSTSLGSVGPETATADLYNQTVTIPANTTKAYMKVSATSVGTTNTGTYYRCNVFYSAM